MDDAQKQSIFSAIRAVLIAIGGGFVTSGKLSAEDLNTYVGAAMVVLPLIWGIWEKFESQTKANQVTSVAVSEAIRLQTPRDAPLDQGEQESIVNRAKGIVKYDNAQ